MSTIASVPDINYDLNDRLADHYDARDLNDAWAGSLGEPIRIDIQKPNDVEHLVCRITVKVSRETARELDLSLRNAPFVEDLRCLLNRRGARIDHREKDLRASIDITLSTSDVDYICELADGFRCMTAPGATYLDSYWKWICPRTARSLERLADIITKAGI